MRGILDVGLVEACAGRKEGSLGRVELGCDGFEYSTNDINGQEFCCVGVGEYQQQ